MIAGSDETHAPSCQILLAETEKYARRRRMATLAPESLRETASNGRRGAGGYFFFCPFSIFAQLSFSETVRLKTSLSRRESIRSTQ